MFHKRLADKIKAGLAWSVISEEGERIPTNNNVKDGESIHDHSPPFPPGTELPEKNDSSPVAVDSPGNMEKMFDNSARKFHPEFLLKKPEKKELTVKEPLVKCPTAAFRAALEKNSVPNELVQSCELLAEAVISMSLSVLSAERVGGTSSKRELPSASDRERSIEFKTYASKEFNRTG